MTCAGWCQKIFHARPGAKLVVHQREKKTDSWMKTWKTKGLLEKPQCCPALTYQLMCIQHGVIPVNSQLVRESLPLKALHILKEQRTESTYNISPAALQSLTFGDSISTKAWSR